MCLSMTSLPVTTIYVKSHVLGVGNIQRSLEPGWGGGGAMKGP